MDMAEKEDAEGRCPACRTPYDKERIVAANCKRLTLDDFNLFKLFCFPFGKFIVVIVR